MKEACIRLVEQDLPEFADKTFRISMNYMVLPTSRDDDFGFSIGVYNNTGYTITEVKVELTDHRRPENTAGHKDVMTIRSFPEIGPNGHLAHGAKDQTDSGMIRPGVRTFYFPIFIPGALPWPGPFTWKVIAMKGFPD